MTADITTPAPVWALATEEVSVPDLFDGAVISSDRLAELRTVLATFASAPVATLEAHPLRATRTRTGGIPLHAASPLAMSLSQLVRQTASAAQKADVTSTGEVLYRMVVPAKVAAQVSQGLVKPMVSKALPGAIYSDLVGGASIVAKSSFLPVTASTGAAGAAAGSAATAGVTAATAGALTIAAPLVLMAVAVSVSAYAEHQRQAAIEKITNLLEQLHEDKLDDERSELDGCVDAIEKATSVLLDEGRIGTSLGLDSAVHAISTAVARARKRLDKWQDVLAKLPDGPVEIAVLDQAFPGIGQEGGLFRAHLELARLSLAMRRRVLVLQAVEHAQRENAERPFATFVRTLSDDQRRVDEMEARLSSVLLRLSTLELKRHGGVRHLVFTQGEVDGLLKTAYRLRALGDDVRQGRDASDVAIEIERSKDGSLIVFPAEAV